MSKRTFGSPNSPCYLTELLCTNRSVSVLWPRLYRACINQPIPMDEKMEMEMEVEMERLYQSAASKSLARPCTYVFIHTQEFGLLRLRPRPVRARQCGEASESST